MFSGGSLLNAAGAQNNTFGQASNNSSGLFSSTNQISGTTCPYQPVDSTDSIQKNSQNVNITTKLHCLTAMKAYENKSVEELRSEDYQANRLSKTTNTIFTGQQNMGMMNSQPTMFTSYTTNQQSQSSPFVNTTQQTNSFGNKTLFSGTNATSNTGFGAFNNQAKPTPLFSTTNTTNKPLFPAVQAQPTGSIFGSSAVSSPSTLFGAQQQHVQSSSFFGTSQQSQVQPSQSTGIFGTTNTSSFGFHPQTNTSLFGTTSKGFGTTSGFTATSSTPSVFGSTASTTSGIFGQQAQSTGFGTAAKAPLFSSTFAPQPATNQGTSLFGNPTPTPLAQPGLFGNQQKQTSSFGSTSIFSNTTPKPSLFGNATINTPFASQPSTGFGVFSGATQPFNAQAVSSSNVMPTIGYSSPAEALLQQQMTQQKILSLVSNRPYGVNKLFLGQSLNSDKVFTSTDTVTNNTNLMSLAIKRNDTDKYGMVSRRNILNQKTKVIPNNLYKVFSGFDDEDDSSIKSGNIEKHFFTKRDDWKYLPPNAFDRSRVSINSSNAALNNNSFINRSINGNTSINSNNSLLNSSDLQLDSSRYPNLLSSPISNTGRLIKSGKDKCYSTPIQDFSPSDLTFNVPYSPIRANGTVLDSNSREQGLANRLGASSFEHVHENVDENVCTNESVIGQSHTHKEEKEEVVDELITNRCLIKLTKDGYYTAPMPEVLDTLVTKNDDGELECWVKNFIIGRKSFGSIRFPGLTNVYGLDFDALVDIRRKEVSVYPDEEMKPDIDEELNKKAQVILQEVWPIDKSTKKTIDNEERLLAMNFEAKLRRVTEKMGARFISYTAAKGVWVFEVDHFSKYRYDESDDDDETKMDDYTTTNTAARESHAPNRGHTSDTKSSMIISAEADSMTTFPNEQEMPTLKVGLQRLFDHTNNRHVHQMKQNLYQYDDDEEDVDNSRMFPPTINRSFIGNLRQKEEPQAKRFETLEMGRSMLNSSLNNSTSEYKKQQHVIVRDIDMEINDYDSRKMKPIPAESIASTEPIARRGRDAQSLTIPNQFRDIRSMKMPYLPQKLKQYFDIDLTIINKKRPFDAGMCQGNRFRVGFHMSSNEESLGLKFTRKDYSNHPDVNLSSLAVIRHENIRYNAINLMKLEYNFSDYQEQLLQSALQGSAFSFNNKEDCPLWKPLQDLKVLNNYVNVQNHQQNSLVTEVHNFGRIVSLCRALWADIGDNDVQSPTHLKHLERKQSLSKWIRMESRNELTKKVESVLRASPAVDIVKCNDIILESLCCGEIKLACKLATSTKQHRMALLISQSAGSLQNRTAIREQLNLWISEKSDQNIPSNIMGIYVLLSGMTSVTTSDNSIITPMKQLKWYQAFGCYQWFIQPYLDSIKSSLDLYEEDFNSDQDIPAPFPISSSDTTADDCYPYYDCCFHLLKFSCDSLHDLDVLLNPPTVSRSTDHKLSLDWSPSWHLSNILSSLGRNITSNDKLCHEWAAQLERAGQWHWAVFILLHIDNSKERKSAVKRAVIRNVTGSKQLSTREVFVVDELKVPSAWLYEGKAIYCKNEGNGELEAYHWLMVGDEEKSHRIYIDEVLPQLLLNDRLDKMADILGQFTTERGLHKHLSGWAQGGGIYVQYLAVMHRLKTLTVANKVMKYAVLADSCAQIPDSILEQHRDDGTFESQLQSLQTNIRRLSLALDSYATSNDTKIICKRQMVTVCQQFLRSWPRADL